ncbi:MAG: esterase [Acidobacteria bacterium]|nr:esterase [Acidobacteriota bacterium]
MRLPLALAAATILVAQDAPRRVNTYRSSGLQTAGQNRFVSPEIHTDGRVTFRVRAPKASEVILNLSGSKPQPLSKNSEGVWTLTIGPLKSELYSYTYSVDGMRVLDQANASLKTGINGLDASLLDLAIPNARFDSVQNVPHGATHIRTYFSKVMNRDRGLYVYVPPQYDTEPNRRFPVLYLRHGFGDTESNWSIDGRAGVILENMIANKKAVPMLIVMTYGYTDLTWAGGSSPEGIDKLGAELLTDVIPFVEKNYRSAPGRLNRAIAGLSMGGGQAFTIGIKNMDKFAWIGEFSSGLLSGVDFDIEKVVPGFIKNADKANANLKLLYIGCGEQDPRIAGHEDLSALLKKHSIHHEYATTQGAHEWKVWRTLLAGFLVRAFQSE